MTIYLEKKEVPAQLQGLFGYNGKKYEVEVREDYTINSQAGTWSGGSRDQFRLVELETGKEVDAINHGLAPWNNARQDVKIPLLKGLALVRHTIFCGKDMGLTFYLHPENASKMLPEKQELSNIEQIVLCATRSLKSSYNGQNRFEMVKGDYSQGFKGLTLELWESGKQLLIDKKLLNKRGAITVQGRNAIGDIQLHSLSLEGGK